MNLFTYEKGYCFVYYLSQLCGDPGRFDSFLRVSVHTYMFFWRLRVVPFLIWEGEGEYFSWFIVFFIYKYIYFFKLSFTFLSTCPYFSIFIFLTVCVVLHQKEATFLLTVIYPCHCFRPTLRSTNLPVLWLKIFWIPSWIFFQIWKSNVLRAKQVGCSLLSCQN